MAEGDRNVAHGIKTKKMKNQKTECALCQESSYKYIGELKYCKGHYGMFRKKRDTPVIERVITIIFAFALGFYLASLLS